MPEAVDSTGLENTNRTINSIPNIKSDNFNHSMINCKGCDRPILDKYLSWVSNASWHSDCVTCCECKAKLSERCFFREGKLFCRTDFFRWVIIKIKSSETKRKKTRTFNSCSSISCNNLFSFPDQFFCLFNIFDPTLSSSTKMNQNCRLFIVITCTSNQ